MKKNDSLGKIAEIIGEADSVLIFPHILMDGDAMGSATALCMALRNMGKEAWVLLEDKIADYLAFMDNGCCTHKQDIIASPDISLCIDCGETGRFPNRTEAFEKGRTKICIDHHKTSDPFCDYNHIDSSSAATGELVYLLLREMGAEFTAQICESLFAAITTDTGNFQYSNTTIRSHEITVALMKEGVDVNKVSVELYENEKPEKFRLHNMVMDTMEIFAEGKAVIAYVTRDMIKKSKALMEDTEGLVSALRSLRGIQIAMLLKENSDGSYKVTMRAKTQGDVAAIASRYDGGGHTKAAGCTINDSLENAMKIMKREAEKQLDQ